MRRDSIFYQLFQQSPGLLFELLDDKPDNAENYRFDSVAVKEPKFEIDGVFLPPESEPPGVIYFCEVQFQKDEKLYERLFAELFLYFYQNRDRFSDWQAVVIYPLRSVEQSNTQPYQDLLNGDRLCRVYLNELGDIEKLPLGVALMALTTVDETSAPEIARLLLARSRQEKQPLEAQRVIMDMVTTILVYKFTKLSRQEIEAMLGLNLQETRFYQEARAEGEQIGEQRERSLILRQLKRRLGEIPDRALEHINTLSIDQLESLGEALLDFGSIDDLISWLSNHHA